MYSYEVIIVGGGPTGVALAIELGLHNIKTLVLEKYEASLLSPRAQLINARSMELFMRWKLDEPLKEKQKLSEDFPNRGVWCSSLRGKTYAISNSNDLLNDSLSPQLNIRIPLWLTEEVLRNKLIEFPCVHFLKQHEVIDVILDKDSVIVSARKMNGQIVNFKAGYVVGCDGTNSITRQKVGIRYQHLAPSKRVISVVFKIDEFKKYITVSPGCLFFLLEKSLPTTIGAIDYRNGLWYAQIVYSGPEQIIAEVNVDSLLEEALGAALPVKIVSAHFWDMHIQVAEHFTAHNRVFLVGDSAHGFVPTGALGLNTGFGDVVNLGWKLSAVIHEQTAPELLSTYEQERYPICLNNLKISQKNADDMVQLKAKHHPAKDPEAFAQANAELANQFINSLGATMGYAYFDSPLIQLQPNQSILPMPKEKYIPTAAPGYFLPHIRIYSNQTIYEILSPIHWTLIISGDYNYQQAQTWQESFNQNISGLQILNLPENSYPSKFILIRPDWHIAFAADELETPDY